VLLCSQGPSCEQPHPSPPTQSELNAELMSHSDKTPTGEAFCKPSKRGSKISGVACEARRNCIDKLRMNDGVWRTMRMPLRELTEVAMSISCLHGVMNSLYPWNQHHCWLSIEGGDVEHCGVAIKGEGNVRQAYLRQNRFGPTTTNSHHNWRESLLTVSTRTGV